MTASGDKPAGQVTVWDPVVRLFHWTVVTGVLVNSFVLDDGKAVHRYIGYVVLAAVVIRLTWGLVARGHARLSSFIPGPRTLRTYLRQLLRGREPRYIGHNPAGAVMMIGLVLLLLGCGVTGWMMGLDQFWGEEWVQELHETLANAILALAALHVLAAIIESVRHRENLVWSMFTGRKPAPGRSDIDNAPAAR
jgi:cytochrome b